MKNQIIGLATGAYDILHAGHISFLETAKSQCDKLIVGINTDKIINQFKGPNRPINTQENRKKVLEALKCVDEVFIFDTWEVEPVIAQYKPDIYFITEGDPGEEVKVKVAKKYDSKLVKLESYNKNDPFESKDVSKMVKLPLCPFYFYYNQKPQKPKFALAKMSTTDIIKRLEALGQ